MGHCPSYDPLSAGGRQTDTSELGADVRAMAQVYTAEAILALVAIMRGKGQGRERIHAQARAYAASALLDHQTESATQMTSCRSILDAQTWISATTPFEHADRKTGTSRTGWIREVGAGLRPNTFTLVLAPAIPLPEFIVHGQFESEKRSQHHPNTADTRALRSRRRPFVITNRPPRNERPSHRATGFA
jgi:hypothetical protein